MNEIESLIVRLTGDGSEYQRMLKEAEDSSAKTGSAIERISRQIEGLHGSITGFAAMALRGLTSLGAVVGLKQVFDQFSQYERNNIRLKAAIEANGRASEPLIAQYQETARQLRQNTLTTEGQAMALFRMAEAQQVTGDHARNAVVNAVALAGATDMSAESTIRATIAMERGNYQYAARLLRIRDIKDKEQLRTEVVKRLNSGMAQQEAITNTTSGALQRLSQTTQVLFRDLGGLVAQAIRPVVDWLQRAVDWFKQLDPIIKTAVIAVVGLTGVLIAVGPWLGTIAAALSTVGGVIAALMSPIGLVIAGVAILASRWVQSVGGMAKAWEIVSTWAATAWAAVQSRISAFMTWAYPIWQAFMGVLGAYWEWIVGIVEAAWDAISGTISAVVGVLSSIWSSMFGDAKVNWDKIRDLIRDTIVFIEYWMRGMGRTIERVWLNSKLRVLEFRNLFGGGLQGQIDGVNARFRQLDRAAAETWQQFRARRIREMAEAAQSGSPEAQNAARAGIQIGAAMVGGATKELHKFDAALAFSAEAATRLEHYVDKMMKKDEGGESDPAGGGGGRVGGVLGAAAAAVQQAPATPSITGGGNAPPRTGEDLVVGFLRAIEGHTRNMANRLGVEPAAAGLRG